MDKVTAALQHWLAKNDLQREGVRLILEFPKYPDAAQAEMCIKRDTDALTRYFTSTGELTTMNGIGLTIRSADERKR